MHVSLSRAREHCRGRLLTGAALSLTGTLLAASLFAVSPHAAQRADADAMITGTIAPRVQDVPFELRIEITSPGKEGIELAGRLSEDGGLITRPVRWKVSRALSDGGIAATGSNSIYEGDQPATSLALKPGRYAIEASYGSVSLVKEFDLPEGQHLGFIFVFNVGGLRTLSTIAKEPLPTPARAVHKVYAIGGVSAGQLVATSDIPGGLMRLGAGKYRLESEIEPGNTVTRTDVSIKPGVLTTLQLDHQAGIASVETAGSTAWTIADRMSTWTATGKGPQLLTLAPGTYTWSDGTRKRTVIIEAGKRTQVRGLD